MSLSSDPIVIASAIGKIESEIGRIEDMRAKNRQLSIIVCGAVIGFMIKEQFIHNIVLMAFSEVLVALVYWYQDFRLHRYRHGWNAVDKRIRKFVRGEISEKEARLLDYDYDAENKAKFLSRSSGLTYLILIMGGVIVALYKCLIIAYN